MEVEDLAFSPDGKILAGISVFGDAVKLWNTETWEVVHTLEITHGTWLSVRMARCWLRLAPM